MEEKLLGQRVACYAVYRGEETPRCFCFGTRRIAGGKDFFAGMRLHGGEDVRISSLPSNLRASCVFLAAQTRSASRVASLIEIRPRS